MFDIYIKNYERNGEFIDRETLIQTIPAASEGGLRLISPQIKNEMGNAESFDFSIEPGTPFYDAFLQMKTMIRVEYDGDNIFYGRVLTVENNRFSGARKVRCEGAISLLMDSPVKGVKEANRSKVSTYTYMSGLITAHNDYIGDADKRFIVGQVPGNYSGVNSDQQLDEDTRKFGADSWSDTKSALEDLRSHFGGYFRTRTTRFGNGIYLDWLDNYFNPTTNAQTIQVSKNLLDISDITEVDNIFTVLVPLGTYQNTSNSSDSSSSSSSSSTTDNTMYIDGTYLPVPDILSEFSYSELNRGYHKDKDYENAIRRYGAIFKTVQFSNATSKSDLREKACEWIKDNYYGEVVKYTIKAIDLHQIGEDVPKILVGDLVRLVYPVIKEDGTDYREEKTRTCMSATYDLYHPENNSYTFGIPANILTSMYGISNTSSVSSNSTSTGGNGGEAEDEEGTPWGMISNWLMNHRMYYDWEQWGSDYFPWTTEFYGDDLDHMHGPSGNNDKEYMFNPGQYIYRFSYSIDSEYDARLYKQILSQDGMLSALSYKSAHCHWSYAKDTSIRYMEESNYIDILNDYNIREYVMMEYGFDLLAWASVSGLVAMGNTIVSAVIQGFTDTAGNTIKRVAFGSSILTGMFGDAEDNPFTKLFAFTDDPFEFNQKPVAAISNVATGLGETFSNSLIQFFGNLNSNQPTSWVDHDGTLHWYYEDPKSPGTYVETTNRSLNLKAVNSDNFIGTMVTQDYADADGNIRIYKFGQGIEEWAHGELVVAHVEGDLTYIGGRDSMYTAQTSLQHMDNICGDFSYETVDGIQYVNVHTGGGMRVTSFKRDENGDPIVDEHGNYVTAQFGVFDDNNLNAGVIAAKLNNNHTNTKLLGDIIQIGSKTATQTISDIEQDLINKGNTITTISGNLTQAQADIVTNAQAIYNHGVSITAINSDITAINSDITLIGDDLTDAQLAIAANGRSITAINSDVVDITGQLNAVKANFESLFTKTGSAWKLTTHYANFTGPVSFTFNQDYGSGITVGADQFLKKLKIVQNTSNNTYTLKYLLAGLSDDDGNYFDVGTFSRAVSSWTDLWDASGNLSVRANPQNQTHSIPMELRAEGQSQYDNMDVVLGSTANGTFTARKKKYIYLTLDSTGSNATVSARADSRQGTAYASIPVSDVWTAGYNYNLPANISIGSLTNAGTSTPSGTNVSAFSTSSIWSSFPNTYGYLKFPVTVHGQTKNYYFAFDNRRTSSGGNPAYGAGYSAGNTAGYNSGYNDGNSVGYNNGYSAGYTAGYNAGEASGSSPTIDIPSNRIQFSYDGNAIPSYTILNDLSDEMNSNTHGYVFFRVDAGNTSKWYRLTTR